MSSSNRLLSSLSTSDFSLPAPHLEAVTLGLRKMLEKPNKKIEAVYFPETGFASVVAVQRNGKQVEMGLIGCEGMTGLPIVLGNHRSPHATYIEAPNGPVHSRGEVAPGDRGQRVSSLLAVEVRSGVRRAHRPTPRSATHDRKLTSDSPAGSSSWRKTNPGRHPALTHEFLSLMLAVRRPGVTEALKALQQRGLIRIGEGKSRSTTAREWRASPAKLDGIRNPNIGD